MKNVALINLIALLTFFPFFKVIPNIDAEIQPIAAFFSIVYILLYDINKWREIYNKTFPYLFVFGGYFLLSCFSLMKGDIGMPYLSQSISVFLAPLVIFIVLLDRISLISISVFKFSIYSWFCLSFFQLFASQLLNMTGISFVLSNIISRFSAETVSAGRGVAAFAPEPSYAAHNILLMLAFAIFYHRRKEISKKEFYTMIVMILFMVMSNQSGTIGLFMSSFALSYGIFEVVKGGKNSAIVLNISMILLGLFVLLIALFPMILELRFFFIISEFISSITGQAGKSFNALEFSDTFGSARGSSVQVGYESIFHTNGFGLGMGGWGTKSVEMARKTKVAEMSEYLFVYGDTPIKPYAYGSFVAMEMGIIGLISMSVTFFSIILERLKVERNMSSFSFACLCLFVIGVYYNAPTSLPAHWVLLNLFFEDRGN
jgi:hypothetical protein